jgi:choline transport protein
MPRLGYVSNIVIVAWTAAILFLFSFSYYHPVVVNEMNYTSCIVVAFVLYSVAYGFMYGRRHIVLPNASEMILA